MAYLKRMDLPIEGMHCASCVLSVNKTFGKIEGVEEVDADLAANRLHITINPKKISYEEMERLVKNLGFELHSDEMTLRIQGMHCASCTMNVENFLIRVDGIFDVKADLTSQTAKIRYDSSKLDMNEVEKVIESLGFELLGIEGQTEIDEEAIYQQDLKDKLTRIIVGVVFTAILMILMFSGWDPLMGPIASLNQVTGLHISAMGLLSLIVSIGPFIYISLPILKAGWNGLSHKNLNMDVMYSMGIMVAYVSSIFGTFGIVLDHTFMFYDSAVMLPAFLMIGRYLEARAKKRTSDSIRELIGLQPTVAISIEVDENGEITSQKEVSIADIVLNDLLLVKPGEKIPVDGDVVGGESCVDESMINGEPIPKVKKDGEEVFAGTINQDGVLYIKAKKIGKETVLSNIIRLVEKAQSSRPPVQKFANTIVSYFIPVILTIAIVVFLIWYFVLGETLLFSLTCLISILVVACPCALGLATPTAVTVGVGRAAEFGILIKNGDTLENAGQLDVAAFDKTGTITEGKPEVDDIIAYATSEEDLIKLVASVEQNSTHPIAKAIVNKAKELNIELDQTTSFENVTGKGLKAEINSKEILAGNLALMESENVEVSSKLADKYYELEKLSKTIIFLAEDKTVKGILSLSDKIKENSRRTIEELHKMGVQTYMLTGDNESTALNVAREVGIDNVKASVLPENKLEIVKDAQSNHTKKVLFVGDGINDAPALTQADIGVAMGNGTDIAMESGDVVVMEGDLENVVAAIQFSKKVMRRIKENIFWAFAYNSILIPIAAGILYPAFGITFEPALAGLAMAMSSVTVISLSLMLKRYVPEIKRKSNI
ncbi:MULTISPECIES: heavy metal translocating P-type ATPase [Methanobrevibacter]|uniref:Cu+-exporting ATPase n=1 Tax=Methanobrevibacter gottschalkii DSM 11977 TaxID=1122229 RepID=A0A3N5BBC4_9EURY|nr:MULTISPECIES: heavy metal translocating P-type ATPase [Methanobrevibacter]OEC93927.1 copper-translocating P-type ATPase [Methanobrevibacter sp. A27]RPF52740.1 Cu+-exporting ATPase [Methanobrevibacter gottschalkii DSM 11977]